MDKELKQYLDKRFAVVETLVKKVDNLEKQTGLNCKKLTKIGKEIPIIRVRLDTLCSASKNTETHLNRIEKKFNRQFMKK